MTKYALMKWLWIICRGYPSIHNNTNKSHMIYSKNTGCLTGIWPAGGAVQAWWSSPKREREHIDTEEEEGGAVVRSCWGGRWESRAPTSGRSSCLQASGVQRDVHHKSDIETGPTLTQTPMGRWILLHFTWIEAQLFLSILTGSQCFISLWKKSIR